MSNDKILEIHKDINCHSVNVIYYLKCDMCSEKETYIGKPIGDTVKDSKVRIEQHISDGKTGNSLRHISSCGVESNCLQETFFRLKFMLRLNKSNTFETLQKYFHLKDFDAMSNLNRK